LAADENINRKAIETIRISADKAQKKYEVKSAVDVASLNNTRNKIRFRRCHGHFFTCSAHAPLTIKR